MSSNHTIHQTIRWAARIGSIASIGVLGMFVFGGEESMQIPTFNELIGFLLFPVSIILGMVIGWAAEKAGGLITLIGLAGFYAWHSVQSGNLPSGPWFAIFAAPGLLFLISGLMRGSKGSGQMPHNTSSSLSP